MTTSFRLPMHYIIIQGSNKEAIKIMPYASINDLPEDVQEYLPNHAQEIYKESYDNAWDEYEDPDDRQGSESREAAAHKVAWNVVENKYAKGNDGDWHKKD